MIQLKKSGPRIYNLFPRILGSMDKWDAHLNRIAEMGFDWVFMNPLSYPGFSGSLYAVKDHYKFNPTFAPEGAEKPESWAPLVELISECHAKGIKFMYDLVINHVSIDSDLLETHPEWFVKKWALIDNAIGKPVKFFKLTDIPDDTQYSSERYYIEERIANPVAIDPADARVEIIWGDLAEIDYDHPRQDLIQYWKDLVDFYIDLKMDGFRCDAAYSVPSTVWEPIIARAKYQNPNIVFVAETLGCRLEELDQVLTSGFDYMFCSSKWWDFTEPWLIDQYNMFKDDAVSISFPESHDTERLAKETEGRQDVQEFRYFFAAFFSAGVLMPIGYEYGFQKKLDVVDMEPRDWEKPKFNISPFIKKVNNFKKSIECLNENGPIKHFDYGDGAILILRKSTIDGNQHLLLVYNKDWYQNQLVQLDNLRYFLDLDAPIQSVTIDMEKELVEKNSWSKDLKPNEYFLFLQEK
ncbi:MAG: alpha-amylase family glycosyl hydrolase [Candidatus Hodarchaeota archaeon]